MSVPQNENLHVLLLYETVYSYPNVHIYNELKFKHYAQQFGVQTEEERQR